MFSGSTSFLVFAKASTLMNCKIETLCIKTNIRVSFTPPEVMDEDCLKILYYHHENFTMCQRVVEIRMNEGNEESSKQLEPDLSEVYIQKIGSGPSRHYYVLVERDRTYSEADVDFMTIRDEVVDDFSTDEETLETINSTSNAIGAAFGARPRQGTNHRGKPKVKTGDKVGKKGHYTMEENDIAFKNKLKLRNDQELEKLENQKKLDFWKNRNWREVEGACKVKSQLYHERARQNSEIRVIERALEAKRVHDKARKEARSARRATGHRRERNREKLKIPSRVEGESSVTFYTSETATMEGTLPSDSDSVPELELNPEE